MGGMDDLPDTIPCPKCGQGAAAVFSVQRYKMVDNAIVPAVFDKDYRCSCGMTFRHRALSPKLGLPAQNWPLVEALLACLNGVFDLLVLLPRIRSTAS